MKAKSEPDGDIRSVAETTTPVVILDIHGEPIDPIWAAEFRGFFWGEGTIDVQAHRPSQRVLVTMPDRAPGEPDPRGGSPNWYRKGYAFWSSARIGLRSDDDAVLYEFHRRLGGRIHVEKLKPNGTTITRWAVSEAHLLPRIAQLLQSPTGLPFKKARQLALWKEAVELKLRAGGTRQSRYTDEERDFLYHVHLEMKRLRAYDR